MKPISGTQRSSSKEVNMKQATAVSAPTVPESSEEANPKVEQP